MRPILSYAIGLLAIPASRRHEASPENVALLCEEVVAQDFHLSKLRDMSEAMAEDDGLWFVAQTASEAYLQQELRKLCAAIESSQTDGASPAPTKVRHHP